MSINMMRIFILCEIMDITGNWILIVSSDLQIVLVMAYFKNNSEINMQ